VHHYTLKASKKAKKWAAIAEADCQTEGAKAVVVITGAPAAAAELIKGGLPWGLPQP
jgi:precorrin isomerase